TGSAEPLFYRRRLPRGVRLQQAPARPPAPRRLRGGMQGQLRGVTRETPTPPGLISSRVTPPIRGPPKGPGVGAGGPGGVLGGGDPRHPLPSRRALRRGNPAYKATTEVAGDGRWGSRRGAYERGWGRQHNAPGARLPASAVDARAAPGRRPPRKGKRCPTRRSENCNAPSTVQPRQMEIAGSTRCGTSSTA